MRRRILFFGTPLLVAALATALVLFFAPKASPGPNVPHADESSDRDEPRVVWSPESVTATVSPSETHSVQVTFVASKNLRRAVLDVSPELTSLVHVEPTSIERVGKDEPVQVQLVFAPDSSAGLGTATGTIRLRKIEGESDPKEENDLFAPLLPVTLNIWQHLTNVHDGYSLLYPPEWIASSSALFGANLYAPEAQANLDADEHYTPPDVLGPQRREPPLAAFVDLGDQVLLAVGEGAFERDFLTILTSMTFE